jgi:hypothetical protein
VAAHCLTDVTFVFVVDIEKMVSIKGMIIRCSSVIPELKEAVFRCLVCGFYSEPVMVDRGIILLRWIVVSPSADLWSSFLTSYCVYQTSL